jgi:ABC-type phosphate/phosphonate transport system substrate-binding protein
LFLERLCNETAKTTPEKFFSKVTRPENAEAALDALCDDEVQCAVVENVSLETYKLVKAGPFRRLRLLQQSEVFPPGAIAYFEGKVSTDLLNRFKAGMLKANNSERAKEMMATFKITAFETVPANYDEMLANTRKLYPAPAASATGK